MHPTTPAAPAAHPSLALFAAGHRALEAGNPADAIQSLDAGLAAYDAVALALPRLHRHGLFLDLDLWHGLVQAHLDLARIYSLPLLPGTVLPESWNPKTVRWADLVFCHLDHAIDCGMHRWETLEGAGYPPAITGDPRWLQLRDEMVRAAGRIPPWTEPFQRAQLCEQRGEYPQRVKAYMDAITAHSSVWHTLTNEERTEFATDPRLRRALASAYYHCACGMASSAAGDTSVVAKAEKMTPAMTAAFRNRAFDYLRFAREQGWHDIAQALADPHLASLRDDPRWKAMWGVWS